MNANNDMIFVLGPPHFFLTATLPALATESNGEDPLRFNYFVNDWNVVGLKDYQRGGADYPG